MGWKGQVEAHEVVCVSVCVREREARGGRGLRAKQRDGPPEADELTRIERRRRRGWPRPRPSPVGPGYGPGWDPAPVAPWGPVARGQLPPGLIGPGTAPPRCHPLAHLECESLVPSFRVGLSPAPIQSQSLAHRAAILSPIQSVSLLYPRLRSVSHPHPFRVSFWPPFRVSLLPSFCAGAPKSLVPSFIQSWSLSLVP